MPPRPAFCRSSLTGHWFRTRSSPPTGTPVSSSTPPAGRKAPAANSSEFTQAEFNFAVFWGLAIQAYEATLVSNDSRFDQFSEGNSGALTAQEQTGLNIFRRSDCDGCHTGPEFTAASFSSVASLDVTLPRGRGGPGGIDTGFFRTGVRPVAEDIALGGIDIFGTPFSIALQQSATPPPPVNGVFKTPTLRNAEFTGPYFHQGGQSTLEQVIDFYSRGGDFPAGGTGPGIRPLNLRPDDRAALAAFLKSLSDDRVRFERGPFDALRSGRRGHGQLRSKLPVERRGQNGQASPAWGRMVIRSRCKPSTSYCRESAWMVRGPIHWPTPALSPDGGLRAAVS